MEKEGSPVCVTGAAGYIGSWLVKKLLQRGHTVHATLRNLEDESKVGLLNRLPHANKRLKLFKADIYNAQEFEPAIQGCRFVFHVATPLLHYTDNPKYKDTTEASVGGVKIIAESCKRSGTVKRLIYTASVTAASPLTEDESGFKDSIDESCWTPLPLSSAYGTMNEQEYLSSKTLSEKEVLRHNGGLEVVSLVCGLVGGDTLLPYLPASVEVVISQALDNAVRHKQLQWLQELLASVPLIHIDDVCEAHIFCMDQTSMAGRFLCACAYPTTAEMANHLSHKYPEIGIRKEDGEGRERGIGCGSTKLIDLGFVYKYDMKKILEDSVECARNMGALS